MSFSALKSVNINVSRSAAPKVALVPTSRYKCDVNALGLKEVSDGSTLLQT